MDYIMKILRTICYYIDNVVFEGIGHVYDLLLKIARTSIFNSGTIEGFYEKIYALIGIFMLFKISFSLITYILNPDDFSDKEKGFASIIKRVILSLVMLVLVPYGFQEAYEVQTIILEDNTLAALIFDDIDNNENAVYQIDTAGDKMKYILMYTFFQPNYSGLAELDSSEYLASCSITYDRKDDGSVNVDPVTGTFTLNPECFGTLTDDKYPVDGNVYGKFWGSEYADKEDLYQTYAHGIERQNFYLLFKLDIALAQTAEKNGVYLVNYMAPLSTVVGIVVLWIFLMFCIDIAVRSVKLGFYELIAPVPILSYIDPKTKDGMLSKWFKQVSTTYLSLFMRLLAIYLAIFIINEVFQNGIADVVTGERIHDWWVLIFIVVGTLMFAKQLPKILEDTLGIKGTGDFSLNPIKKLEDGMLGGKAIKRTAGTAAAMGLAGTAAFGSNLIGGLVNNKGAGKLKAFGSAFAGAGSAMGRAAWGGAKGEKFGKNWASSYGAAMAAKQSRADRKADDVGWGEMMGSKIQQKMGLHTKAETAAAASAGYKAIQDDYKQYEQIATGVDKFAKYADKQAKAAAAAGDFEATQFWEDQKDRRIKEIALQGGKVDTTSTVSDAAFGYYDTVTKKWTATTGDLSTAGSVNGALEQLAGHMDALVASLNKSAVGVDGYDKINKTVAVDGVKAIKNEAMGVQQEIDVKNVHATDVDKYGAKKGQK